MATHDGLSQHGTETGGQTGGTVGATEKVGSSEERLVIVIKTSDEEMVPKRVELRTTAVEKLCEVGVEVGGVKARGVGRGVGLVEGEVDEVAVEILHVGDVAAEANNRGTSE
jgi:hypothetical protein